MCLCGHVQIDGACNCVCFAGRCADAAVDCVVVYASWLASSADDRFSFWAEVVVTARTCMVVLRARSLPATVLKQLDFYIFHAW